MSRPHYVLGLSAFYHDSAAALVKGGEIVAATREEATVVRAEMHPPQTCHVCKGTRFWISHSGVATCCTCHPPAGSSLVRVWLDDGVETPTEREQ